MITSQSTWGKEILHSLHRIYEEMNSNPCKPLRLLSLAASLCADVGDHIQRVPGQINNDQSRIAVWKMTGFIHHNFDLRVTLDDIATAGSVCRSICCELFSTFIGQTPNTYLVQYRIQKGSEMLLGTNRSISEIAMNCGFQSASYFSSVFRNKTGLTPQNYRKKVRTPSHS
ncbi:helix-turn-helix domain-containing protein [Paenibacillus sp. B-A-8]|uniref:helix-turn-helix domain-containing protein n=1 Tax=Paenibacillus sp. B-A-8 TaxID=3400419 RepID=UPI003B017704